MSRSTVRAVTEPPSPEHLSSSSSSLWRHVVKTWALTETDLALLRGALEALDVHHVAMDEVRRDGPTITNARSGNVKMNPGLTAAAVSLRTYRTALAQLDLELPEHPLPRGSVSRRRR